MPATPGMVIGFIAYLFDNGRAGATITSYISAVAYFHKMQGYTDPTTSFLVRKLLVGARALARKGDERLPITTTVGAERQSSVMTLRKPIVTWYVKTFRNVNYVC